MWEFYRAGTVIAEQVDEVLPKAGVTLGLGWVPYIQPERPVAPKILRRLLGQGVQIVTGADSGINNTPRGENVARIAAKASTGMGNAEVLTSATTTAKSLNLDSISGGLAGKPVDIIVVNGNPQCELDAPRNILSVLVRGQKYVPKVAPTTWKEATHAAS